MKTTSLIPNSFQTFVMELRETMNKGLKLIRRITLSTLSKEFANEFRLQKHFKVMYRYDYTGKFISHIDSLAMLGSAPASEYRNQTYRVYFNAERTDYRDVNGDEMISVFHRVNDVSVAQKVKETIENTDYAIAKIRLTKLGNHSYMKKNGRFSAGYSERQTFKTLKGAENTLARLVKAKKVSLSSVKIVSTELSN